MTDAGGEHPSRITPTFRARLRSKSVQEQGRVLECVGRLLVNPRHPGLRTHAMQGHRGVYEARVDRSLRLTFHWDGPVIVLRNNCKHDDTLAHP
jgi:hypothetical protein